MLDRRIAGELTRIAPEAPSPVLKVSGSTADLTYAGGAANVACNLAALGCPAQLIGFVGRDHDGEALAAMCRMYPGVVSGVRYAEGAQTCTKTRLVASGQQLLRYDTDGDFSAASRQYANEMAHCLQLDQKLLLVIADYAKGTLADDVVPWLMAQALMLRVPVFVDARPSKLEGYRGAALVKLNYREAVAFASQFLHPALASDANVDETERAEAAAGIIGKKLDAGIVCITRGASGATVWQGGKVEHVGTKVKPVVDVTGAGDTFLAALAAAWFSRLPIRDAVAFANRAAGVAIACPGTTTVSLAAVRYADMTDPERKTLSADAAVAYAKRLRDIGETVVFTNGCFDLLHPGHLQLLIEAKKYGTVIVGLNSDASVRRLKGDGRPIVPAAQRAQALCYCRAVDAVVVFDEATPMELIKQIKPDVLVKGAEYERGDVVGRDYVAGSGGRIVFAPMLDGFSTTRLAVSA